jgi:hypothetical protein
MHSIVKTLAIALLGASLGGCGGSGGGGDDPPPPAAGCGTMVGDGDESFASAGTITTTVNDSVNGAIANNVGTGADPFDIYAFTAPTGGTYAVRVDWADAAIDIDSRK